MKDASAELFVKHSDRRTHNGTSGSDTGRVTILVHGGTHPDVYMGSADRSTCQCRIGYPIKSSMENFSARNFFFIKKLLTFMYVTLICQTLRTLPHSTKMVSSRLHFFAIFYPLLARSNFFKAFFFSYHILLYNRKCIKC